MLTEQFIASVGVPAKAPSSNAAKDVGILIQEYQPLNTQRTTFKKSATPPNCLAVSNSHVFAAQADKGVVHVYNREKGNQEATVPFTERITCIALACSDSVLILGTQEGHVFLWETTSGRQITTAQTHLQAVTALAVDPTSNFLLSASGDSTIHVWSIPSLLSFSGTTTSPLRIFASHKAHVIALVLGHSSSFSNIAVSASSDRICVVWDYSTNTALRTYLLPLVPTSLAIDPADRGIYVGFEGGSIQLLDFFESASGRSGHISYVSEDSLAPIQPPKSSRWSSSDTSIGSTLSLSVSFDGCSVISGHQSGAMVVWDVARRGAVTSVLQTPLPGPVTNLSFLPVTGYAIEDSQKVKIAEVLKPKFGAFQTSTVGVPGNYAHTLQLISNTTDGKKSDFQQMLDAPSFPNGTIDTGLNELLTWGKVNQIVEGEDDFMALDVPQDKPRQLSLEEQNAALKSELEALRRLQKASFEKLERINDERKALIRREQKKSSTHNSGVASTRTNGIHGNDQMIYDSSSDDP